MKNKKSIMLLPYLIIIAGWNAVIIIMNIFVAMPLFNLPLWYNFVITISSTIAVIALDGLFASISHSQVKKMKPFSKYFAVSKREKIFWKKLGVKKFKEYLPDLGGLVKFKKRSIDEPENKEYIYRYMQESCCGEIGHLLGVFFGFAIIFIFPLKFWLYYGFPIAMLNAILSFLPVISLRYNRYSLSVIYKSLERKENIN